MVIHIRRSEARHLTDERGPSPSLAGWASSSPSDQSPTRLGREEDGDREEEEEAVLFVDEVGWHDVRCGSGGPWAGGTRGRLAGP